MKALSSMTIFLCKSSRRLFTGATPLLPFNSESKTLVGISRFSTLSPDAPTCSSFRLSSKRNSEDNRNVRVSVWWDFECCSIPRDADVYKVTQNITAAVRANGIEGPIEIRAYGDIHRLSLYNQEALHSAGINAIHVPQGGDNSADWDLFMDLIDWLSRNLSPMHLFVISSDNDLSHYLYPYVNKHNILLASTDNASSILCEAASIMWRWTTLVKGENLRGQHSNINPLWYSHYFDPLEDPFVPVTASMENSGHSTSMPSREETLSLPSKLNALKLSTDSEAPPGKHEEQQKVQEQPPLIQKPKEGEMSLSQLDQLEDSVPVTASKLDVLKPCTDSEVPPGKQEQ